MLKIEAIRKLRDLTVRLKSYRATVPVHFSKELEQFDKELTELEIELANQINEFMANDFKRDLAKRKRIEHESSKVEGELLGRWNYNSHKEL